MTIQDLSSSATIATDLIVRGTGTLTVEDYVSIEEHVIIDTGSGGAVLLKRRAKIKSGVVVRTHGGTVTIGERTTIGEYSLLACHGGLEIGALCMFGPYVFVNAADHLICSRDPYRFQGETTRGIVIGEGTWIGAKATILDGVQIGQRAVIGAHALVNRDVPDQAMVVGTPARWIRQVDPIPRRES